MSAARRFQIRRDRWFAPLLLLFGANDDRSHVEVGGDAISARFGWYRAEIPLGHVQAAGRDRWPWYAGIGWRSNLRSVIGLIGAYDGIVKLEIDPPVRTRLLGIPFRVRDFYVSLEDPPAFLAALAERKSTGSTD